MKNALFALVSLILLSAPLAATAQNYQYGDFFFYTDGSAITITGYTGPGGEVTIPSTIASVPVIVIGQGAFQYNTNLTAVTIPDGVTLIAASAFFGCSGLTSVTIPGGVTGIGDNAFYNRTGLTNITILNGIIGNGMFFGCTSLTNITILGTVTNIGTRAFEDCASLTSVTIPGSVTNIGDGVFAGCTTLIAINVDPANAFYSSLDGVLFDKSQTTFVEFPGGKGGSYLIPASVTYIGGSALRDCTSLTSITIPGSVTIIGGEAFYQCTGLTNITIPGSVTVIGNNAFTYCTGLTSVTIPGSVTTIGDWAFDYCTNPSGVTISNGVTSIGERAFDSCFGLTNITLPASVAGIGINSFAQCPSLTTITVDAANEFYSSVDGVLFNKSQTALIEYPGGKAGTYTIPDTVTSIGDYAFSACNNLASITITRNITSIGHFAFYTCLNLASVTILDGLTSIGPEACFDCFGLTYITIARTVTGIGDNAFANCNGLRGVFFTGFPPSASPSFGGVFANSYPTVYYLRPRGWGATFAGRPAVLWNPLMQSSGVGPAGFGFTITGTADIPIVIEAASSLANGDWVSLQSLNLTNGAFDFSDPNWTNYPARFYRIRSP
jgi:hypothetical protein